MDIFVTVNHTDYLVREVEDNQLIEGAFFIGPVFGMEEEDDDSSYLAGLSICDTESSMITQFVGDNAVVRAADYFNEFRQTADNYIVVTLVPDNNCVEDFLRASDAMLARIKGLHGWDANQHNLELLGEE